MKHSNMKPILIILSILLSLIIAKKLWSEPTGCDTLQYSPLVVEYTVSPDIRNYQTGDIVTVNYSITIDKQNEKYIPGKEYLIKLEDYLLGKEMYGNIVRNDVNKNDIISDRKSIHTNTIEFRLLEANDRFMFMLTIYRLSEASDPLASELTLLDGSSYYVDDQYTSILESKTWIGHRAWNDKAGLGEFQEVNLEVPTMKLRNRPGGLVMGVLAGNTIYLTPSEGVEIDHPHIDGINGVHIGEVTQVGNSIKLIVNGAIGNEGYVYFNDEDFYHVEIINHYPLCGYIEVEEHSPFAQGGDGAFFLSEPGYVGNSKTVPAVGIVKLYNFDVDGNGLDDANFDQYQHIADTNLYNNGFFSFGNVSVGCALVTVELFNEDDILLFNCQDRCYSTIKQGIKLYHPEVFPQTWNEAYTIKLTIQINPLSWDDPHAIIEEECPLHVLIKDHNFCAANHVYHEFYRAKHVFNMMNTLNPLRDKLAIYVDQGWPIEPKNFYCSSEMLDAKIPNTGLSGYDAIHLRSQHGDLHPYQSFMDRQWAEWDSFLLFHEMGHYFHMDPVEWNMQEGVCSDPYQKPESHFDQYHSNSAFSEAIAEWFCQLVKAENRSEKYDYVHAFHGWNPSYRYLNLCATYNGDSSEFKYRSPIYLFEFYAVDNLLDSVFRHPEYNLLISSNIRYVNTCYHFLWDLYDSVIDSPGGNWENQWGDIPSDNLSIDLPLLWDYLTRTYIGNTEPQVGRRGSDMYYFIMNLRKLYKNNDATFRKLNDVSRMYHFPYGPDTGLYGHVHIFPNDFPVGTTLQEAINNPSVYPADTLLIQPGTYVVNSQIKKELTIGSRYLDLGDPSMIETTILIAEESEDRVVHLQNTEVSLVGLTFSAEDDDCEYAITVDNSDVVLSRCVMTDFLRSIKVNETSHGVFIDCNIKNCETGIDFNASYRSKFSIENSIFQGNEAAIRGVISSSVDIDIINCVFVDNDRIFSYDAGGNRVNSIKNSIFYENGDYNFNSSTDVAYCNIDLSGGDPYGDPEDCNINEDPLFVDTESDFHLIWDENQKSPCIDTGDPLIKDEDGTPSDMGVYPVDEHDWEIKTLEWSEDDPYEWVCFPIIDTRTTGENVASNFFEDLFNGQLRVTDNILWYDVEGNHYIEVGESNAWTNGDHEISYTQGYIATMDDNYAEDFYNLTKSGFRAPVDTRIYLETNDNGLSRENWIGYFIQEKMDALDALAPVLDDISQIRTERWAMYKGPTGYWFGNCGEDGNVLCYGEMVKVQCVRECNFRWGGDNIIPAIDDFRNTEYYSFDREADYAALYVELDNTERSIPDEVAVFLNGECRGASVVRDSIVQINAYVLSDTTGNDIEIALYYGDRAPSRLIQSYAVLDPNTMKLIGTKLNIDDNGVYFVSLDMDAEEIIPATTAMDQNFPNPFNPTTTIKYSLNQDGPVEIAVYNLKGQKVRQLISANMPAGFHEVVWNGKDSFGKQASSGIYFYRMKTSQKTFVKKMMMIK